MDGQFRNKRPREDSQLDTLRKRERKLSNTSQIYLRQSGILTPLARDADSNTRIKQEEEDWDLPTEGSRQSSRSGCRQRAIDEQSASAGSWREDGLRAQRGGTSTFPLLVEDQPRIFDPDFTADIFARRGLGFVHLELEEIRAHTATLPPLVAKVVIQDVLDRLESRQTPSGRVQHVAERLWDGWYSPLAAALGDHITSTSRLEAVLLCMLEAMPQAANDGPVRAMRSFLGALRESNVQPDRSRAGRARPGTRNGDSTNSLQQSSQGRTPPKPAGLNFRTDAINDIQSLTADTQVPSATDAPRLMSRIKDRRALLLHYVDLFHRTNVGSTEYEGARAQVLCSAKDIWKTFGSNKKQEWSKILERCGHDIDVLTTSEEATALLDSQGVLLKLGLAKRPSCPEAGYASKEDHTDESDSTDEEVDEEVGAPSNTVKTSRPSDVPWKADTKAQTQIVGASPASAMAKLADMSPGANAATVTERVLTPTFVPHVRTNHRPGICGTFVVDVPDAPFNDLQKAEVENAVRSGFPGYPFLFDVQQISPHLWVAVFRQRRHELIGGRILLRNFPVTVGYQYPHPPKLFRWDTTVSISEDEVAGRLFEVLGRGHRPELRLHSSSEGSRRKSWILRFHHAPGWLRFYVPMAQHAPPALIHACFQPWDLRKECITCNRNHAWLKGQNCELSRAVELRPSIRRPVCSVRQILEV